MISDKHERTHQHRDDSIPQPSFHHFSGFADRMPYAIVLFDSKRVIRYINPAAVRLFSFMPSPMVADQSFLPMFAPEETDRLHHITEQLINESYPFAGRPFMAIKSDGVRFPVKLTLESLPEMAGLSLFLAAIEDMTEFKQQELNLLELKEKTSQIIDISPSGIFTVDLQCRITSWNERAAQITGYAANEVLGKPCHFVSQQPCQRYCHLFDHETEKPVLNREGTIKTKSGELRIVNKNIQLMRDAKGHVIGGIECFVDVTDDKKRTIELIQAKDHAEESDKLKSAFLANMSHEIRTPINGILGFAELLRESHLTAEERTEFLDIIRENGKQLLGIINDIIDLSKIEANQLQIKPDLVDIHAMLTELYKFFAYDSRIVEKKIDLHYHFGQEKALVLQTDPVRLRQVLFNLLANAVKFTDAGFIRFGYEFKDESIRFFVTDSGLGIHPSQKVSIFDRFVQADNAGTRKIKGTGLGLAISKGLTELMGGRIGVESVPGTGSEFYFTLPKSVERSATLKPHKPAEDMNYDWANKTILIAEDDNINFKYLEILLKKTNIRIIRASDGEEAINQFRDNENIDLILMDIQMPNIDGYEATQVIKSLRKDVPIIAQTANAMNEDMEHCLEAGCDGYISKPIDKQTLLDKIHLFIQTETPVR